MESAGKIDLVTLVIIATMGIFLLICFVILFVVAHQKKMLAHKHHLREQETIFQQRLLASSFDSAEQERTKLATDLHDDLGMMMNLLKVNLSRVQHNLQHEELVTDLTNNSHEIVDELIGTIRAISHDLMPPTLAKLGLIEGLSELCRQINESGAIPIGFHASVSHVDLEHRKAFHVYRLVKELINNTIRHAGASKLRLEIDPGEQLRIAITHNGTGISNEAIRHLAKTGQGLGLTSTMSRAQIIGATIDYTEAPAGNPGIYLAIPLP